jgi:hypothetical protein
MLLDARDPIPKERAKVMPNAVPPRLGGVWNAMNVLLIVLRAKWVKERAMLKSSRGNP